MPRADGPAWARVEGVPGWTFLRPVTLPLRGGITSVCRGSGLAWWRAAAGTSVLGRAHLLLTARPCDPGRRSCSQGWKHDSKPQSRQRGDACPFAQEASDTSDFCCMSPFILQTSLRMTNSYEP